MKKYKTVRKVSWDELWHVCYKSKNYDGKEYETWDRVSEKEALEIARNLT